MVANTGTTKVINNPMRIIPSPLNFNRLNAYAERTEIGIMMTMEIKEEVIEFFIPLTKD